MKRLAEIRRASAGFTMAEALAAIAVLVVLMAVAIPNAVAYQQSLKATELDNKAEQVYNAAQFQLSSLKTAGRLGVLTPIDENVATPPDYAGAAGVESLRYAVKGDDVTKGYLLPEQATLASRGMMTGDYAIELNPESGEVYAVYYWEPGATGPDGTAFSGTTPAAIESFYLLMSRYRPSDSGSFLAEHHVGYFNGGDVTKVEPPSSSSTSSTSSSSTASSSSSSSSDAGEKTPEPRNGDDLDVPISGVFDDLADGDFDLSKLKLSIRIQEVRYGGYVPSDDFPGTGQMIVRMNGGASNAPAMPNATQYRDVTPSDLGTDLNDLSYVIDSFNADVEQQTLGYVKCGEGVKVTVYAEYEGATRVYGPYVQNASFASVDSSTGTVGVSNARHLANLAYASSLNGQITHISFMSDITYDSSLGPLEPIDVTKMLPSGSNSSIDGNGHVLNGFVIGDADNPADNVGLFTALNVNINDLTLKNPVVCGRNNVGALVGRQENTAISISNCKVVGGTIEGVSNVGGLIGFAERGTLYSNCSSTALVRSTGGGNAGGFVGRAVGSTFENCTAGMSYATANPTVVSGEGCSNIGGFAGCVDANSNVITGCQAYVDVNGLDYVGGFVGRTSDQAWSRIVDCAATASYDINRGTPVFHQVSGRSYIGGFAGNLAALNEISGCRAQLNVSGSGDRVGGFVGHLAVSGSYGMSNCKVESIVSGSGTYSPTYSGSGGNVGAFAGQNDAGNLNNCTSSAVRA